MIRLLYVVAVRHPLWLPPLNTELPPIIEPGNWILSSWSGRCSQYAVKLDLNEWARGRGATPWLKFDYPPLGLIPQYAIEVRLEGDYEPAILNEKPWLEVIGFAE